MTPRPPSTAEAPSRLLLRPPLFLLALCATATATAGAKGSTMIALDLEALARRADEVVVARITGSRAEATRGAILTRHSAVVEVAIAGHLGLNEQLEILVPGGELDGLGLLVQGAPRLIEGQRYLLFLRDRGGPLITVGMAQGAMSVRQAGSSGTLVVDPPASLPSLVERGGGPAAPALLASTPLEPLISRIREARDGQ